MPTYNVTNKLTESSASNETKIKRGVKRVGQVLQTYKKSDAKAQIAVLKMEIDYELLTLYEALLIDDERTIDECKKRLEQLRLKLLEMEKNS